MTKILNIRLTPRGTASRFCLLGALALTLSGCFRYVPAQLETTPPGSGAQVVVTRAGSEELRDVLPNGREGEPVRGTFVEIDGNNAVLSVPISSRQEGMAQRSIEQRVLIPVGEIVSFERRELNPTGTGLLVAGMAGFATAIILAITEARKGENPDDPTPPDESVIDIPIFSILWGR